jgi:DNA-binding NarL/FixJ family response regulator
MVIVDEKRRYIEVNTPARLAFRLSLAELRRLQIDDLTPPHLFSTMEEAWARLIATGLMAGPYEIASPDGCRLDVIYCAVAEALPGLHLISFAPASWPEGELLGELANRGSDPPTSLTPRELQVLELVAEGGAAPMIAEELFISRSTVTTHLEHVYRKLCVRGRAGAVAKAMRLGLIA